MISMDGRILNGPCRATARKRVELALIVSI